MSKKKKEILEKAFRALTETRHFKRGISESHCVVCDAVSNFTWSVYDMSSVLPH